MVSVTWAGRRADGTGGLEYGRSLLGGRGPPAGRLLLREQAYLLLFFGHKLALKRFS
ncbi:hypothetical protein ACFXPJ_07115 [Streptomyces goshikiensis]